VHLLAAAAGAAADSAVGARAARRPLEADRWAATAAGLAGRADDGLRASPTALPPAAAALAVARAEAARAAGRSDPDAWTEVADRWQAMGERYAAGCARLRATEALLAGRRRSAAAEALAEAGATATTIGAAHLLVAVRALSARARLPVEGRPADESRPFHLSARERDVLALVARGRTDRQIGEELFISHRTVERHVSSILAKLDARTRTELTAIAHRDGLVPTS
jgi:DNA-binding NarL/FixJ family response regulator